MRLEHCAVPICRAMLKVLDFSADNDHEPDSNGEYTSATIEAGPLPESFTICSAFMVDGQLLGEGEYKRDEDEYRPANLRLGLGFVPLGSFAAKENTGRVSELNIFNSSLSAERMKGLTTSGGEECGAPGDLVSWAPRAENVKINVTDEPYFGTQIVCNYLPFSKAAKGAQGGPQQYATFERTVFCNFHFSDDQSRWQLLEEGQIIAHFLGRSYDLHIYFGIFCTGCLGRTGRNNDLTRR